MNTVYGSLSIMSDNIFGREQVDVLLSPLLQRPEHSLQSLVLILHFSGYGPVKREWVNIGSSTKSTGVSGCLLRIME